MQPFEPRLVGAGGLEPPLLAELEPKSSVSAIPPRARNTKHYTTLPRRLQNTCAAISIQEGAEAADYGILCAAMKYKAAIFDQDGLLFDTEKTYQASWIEAGRLQGVEIPKEFPKRFCGLSPKDIAKIASEAYPELDVAKYCETAVRLARSAQLASTPEPKPGLSTMLEFCRANGIKTAIASSSAMHIVQHNIRSAGVAEFFDAVATAEEVANCKPAPDIFLLAASKLGVPPAKCVVFEDAFSGIRGAAAAGCAAVLIPDQLQPTDEIAAICTVFPDLAAATAVFNR